MCGLNLTSHGINQTLHSLHRYLHGLILDSCGLNLSLSGLNLTLNWLIRTLSQILEKNTAHSHCPATFITDTELLMKRPTVDHLRPNPEAN